MCSKPRDKGGAASTLRQQIHGDVAPLPSHPSFPCTSPSVGRGGYSSHTAFLLLQMHLTEEMVIF